MCVLKCPKAGVGMVHSGWCQCDGKVQHVPCLWPFRMWQVRCAPQAAAATAATNMGSGGQAPPLGVDQAQREHLLYVSILVV